jgi:hypothetical protein
MSKAAELANLIGNINAGGGGVNRNVLINGAMNVAQRQVSATGIGASSGYFACDRWKITTGNTAGRLTMTQDSSAPSGFANSTKLACTTADTSIAADEITILGQSLEGQNVQAFAKGTSDAKPFVVSFYVKGNASATYVAELYDHDNTRNITQAFSVTTDWARVELTFPADTTGALDDDNAASLTFQIWIHAGSTYSGGTFADNTWGSVTQANRYAGSRTSFFDSTDRTFFLTGVQLEVGQNPTEFEHIKFQDELFRCKRYYTSAYELGYYPADDVAFTNTSGTYQSNVFLNDYARSDIQFVPMMRAEPTITLYSVSGLANGSTAGRWDWFNGSAWAETDIASESGDINSQKWQAQPRDNSMAFGAAIVTAGGWKADAEL